MALAEMFADLFARNASTFQAVATVEHLNLWDRPCKERWCPVCHWYTGVTRRVQDELDDCLGMRR